MAQGLTLCRCSGNVRGINKEQLNLPSSESSLSPPSFLLPTLCQGSLLCNASHSVPFTSLPPPLLQQSPSASAYLDHCSSLLTDLPASVSPSHAGSTEPLHSQIQELLWLPDAGVREMASGAPPSQVYPDLLLFFTLLKSHLCF